MKFLSWLLGFWRKQPETAPAGTTNHNLWKGSGTFYVARYRQGLDQVAERNSAKTCFNPEIKCAEIFSGAEVLAQIHVHGEMGTPYEAVIMAAEPLAKEIRSIFPEKLRIKFESLA